MKQGEQGQQDIVYQQLGMQNLEQIDDQDIEFYDEYFPIDVIDNNMEQRIMDQYVKGQSFCQMNGDNYLNQTNNTSNINSHNLPQTPSTPSGTAPAFQSSHSQEQLIKYQMELLEAQRNRLSLSQSQKYFKQEENSQQVNYTNFNGNESDFLGMQNQHSNRQQPKLPRNQNQLETNNTVIGSAKNERNMFSGKSNNNILNMNNELSYISDNQNFQMIAEDNVNDSLKIEDEIQPIPNDADLKYEEQSYLDSYLIYKNSISQLNCVKDINQEENQQTNSMNYYNNNPNSAFINQFNNEYNKMNAQSQKYFLNQTNFLQNMAEDDGTQEPQRPSNMYPQFMNNNFNEATSNINFNDENVYLEEKYIQDMMFMKRPNSANFLHENLTKSQRICPSTNKNDQKRKTFVETTKTNIQPPTRGKERSVTHNTSFEQKIKKGKTQIGQSKTDKENRLLNKENNLSGLQGKPSYGRDKSSEIDRADQNGMQIGKFISKRYVNKENKKPLTQINQISQKTTEVTLKANEEYLNQKTKNYLEILKKHLRADQINATAVNKGQKQLPTSTGYFQQNPIYNQNKTGKINSANTTMNKNSPTKRLSNIYKATRNTIIPTYTTNDPAQNQTTTTTNTITPPLRQNHSFVIYTQQKNEQRETLEQKQEETKPSIPGQLLQQKTENQPNSYNLNIKNLALQRYNNKNSNNTIQNTLRSNRNNKEEAATIKNILNNIPQPSSLPAATLNTTQAPQKKNPIPPNTLKALQPYIPSTSNTQKQAPTPSSSLFDDININNFKIEQEIGKGSYATVKLAMERNTQIRYALKIYPRFVLLDPHKLRNVKREIQILRKLHHPYIIKMPFALEDKSNQIIVGMEYVGKQSLHGFLKTKTERRLEEPEVKRIFRQIVEGMSFCHKMNVVHRDIKLENILLDQSNNIKIIDFGFSIINGEDKKLKIFCGTPSYMAPEIVSKVEYVGQKADIWALGILLYVMLQGKFPFKGVNDTELFKKIKKGCYSYTYPVSSEAEKLIASLLNVKPSERPSASLILEHSWFSTY